MEISLYLKRPKEDKPTVIYAHIWYSGKELRYFLPESIHPKYWNKSTQRARAMRGFYEATDLNDVLDKHIATIKNIIRRYMVANNNHVPAPEDLRQLLNEAIRPSEVKQEIKHTFTSYFRDIIRRSKDGTRVDPRTGVIKPSTIKTYETALARIEGYEKKVGKVLQFSDIDLSFHQSFTEYMTKDMGLAMNTIGKQFKFVMLVMNEAVQARLTTNIDHKSRGFIAMSEDTDAIYLSVDELEAMSATDLQGNKRLEQVRDLFMIGCYTGLRFSDYSILKPEQVKNGFIEVAKQVKTGAPVSIPVHPVVAAIMDKYNGHLPPAISNQNFNEYIREVAKKVDALKEKQETITYTKGGKKVSETFQKWELVSTHTARRSFATNEFLAGTPTLIIMSITGHKTEKSFLRYIRVKQNEHAQDLAKIWQERNKPTPPAPTTTPGKKAKVIELKSKTA